MASRLILFLKSTVAKMTMTLEQTRQAIIDRMQSFTGITPRQNPVSQIYQALMYLKMVFGAA